MKSIINTRLDTKKDVDDIADDSIVPLTPEQQQQLQATIEQGLPLSLTPYLVIADKLGVLEQQVRWQIKQWQENGLIKRLGLVVKHRKLGYKANAMVVWDIPDEQVDIVAQQLSSRPEVSLCYRRPRRLPHWSYNLFCMIHGTERNIVLSQLSNMITEFALENVKKDVLFSTKAFKQQGARYTNTEYIDKESTHV